MQAVITCFIFCQLIMDSVNEVNFFTQRENGLEYSEAYDAANQPETESGLMINPAVKAAVESQFAIPDFPPKKGEIKVR